MNSHTKLQPISSLNTNQTTKVAVAYGDGIGPEIMRVTLQILEAAGANIEPEFIELSRCRCRSLAARS